ncbi:hypothetical protein E2C01_010833 [Portunus trituberculatus]|uniref:Uncharacterized protein n=1 Tax=Portunus trituberculatus TaxID=210409 RepID=A0A5B7D9N2_PORTR|nr:hypothetical protein [Portunus trituberculatus]
MYSPINNMPVVTMRTKDHRHFEIISTEELRWPQLADGRRENFSQSPIQSEKSQHNFSTQQCMFRPCTHKHTCKQYTVINQQDVNGLWDSSLFSNELVIQVSSDVSGVSDLAQNFSQVPPAST